MEKKQYIRPVVDAFNIETIEMIAASSVGTTLSFDGDGGSTELQEGDLGEEIFGLSRTLDVIPF